MRHEQSPRGTESNTPMFMTYSFVIFKIIDKHNKVYLYAFERINTFIIIIIIIGLFQRQKCNNNVNNESYN